MSDLISDALGAAASRSVWAPALAAAAGVATSFGPCAAPRFAVAAGLIAQRSGLRRAVTVASLVGGLCAGYVGLGIAGGAAGLLARYSTIAYWCVSALLIASGINALVRAHASASCDAGCSVRDKPAAAGAGFAAGIGFAAVLSPCCGPLAAAIAGLTSASGSTIATAEILAAFAVGHSLPLIAFAGAYARIEGLVHRARPALSAASTVGGALMVAMGAYYGLLA